MAESRASPWHRGFGDRLSRSPSRSGRWARFSGVGALGVGVQLSVLALLTHLGGTHYQGSTVIAVEAAIIHNFCWHLRWTWSDRRSGRASPFQGLKKFLRFNLATGATSILGNLGFMTLLVGRVGFGVLRANLIAIALCSLINYLALDNWVFKKGVCRF